MQKVLRTFYANITNPGEAEPDSDHEEAAPPVQAESVERELSHGARGESETADGGSGAIKKRGKYMSEGPTTYKLLKPVLKAIKDARSTE